MCMYYLGGCNIQLPDDGWDPIVAYHIDYFHQLIVLIVGVVLLVVPLFITWRHKKKKKNREIESFLNEE